MTKSLVLTTLLTVIVMSCNRKTTDAVVRDCDHSFELGVPFALGVADKACNTSLDLHITLDSVFDDSRCPTGVNCIWEGNAKMRFQFQKGKKMFRFDLDTQPTSNFYQHDTVLSGYQISVHQLSPYPSENTVIKQTDYAVEISVNPAS